MMATVGYPVLVDMGGAFGRAQSGCTGRRYLSGQEEVGCPILVDTGGTFGGAGVVY